MHRKILFAGWIPATALALACLASCESPNPPVTKASDTSVAFDTTKAASEPAKTTTESKMTVTEPAKTTSESNKTETESPKATTESIKTTDASNADAAKTLTEADKGKTVNVKVGDIVAIQLNGNPTTGFTWRTAKLDGDALEQLGDPKYTNNAHPAGMVGVGGVFVFKFKAAQKGKTVANLENVRPWEKDKPPVQTFAATVEVGDQ